MSLYLINKFSATENCLSNLKSLLKQSCNSTKSCLLRLAIMYEMRKINEKKWDKKIFRLIKKMESETDSINQEITNETSNNGIFADLELFIIILKILILSDQNLFQIHKDKIYQYSFFYDKIIKTMSIKAIHTTELFNITISFSNESEYSSFCDGKYLNGKRFDIQLINNLLKIKMILNYVRNIKISFNDYYTTAEHLKIITQKLNFYVKKINNIRMFLKDNLVETDDIDQIAKDLNQIKNYYKKVVNLIKVDNIIKQLENDEFSCLPKLDLESAYLVEHSESISSREQLNNLLNCDVINKKKLLISKFIIVKDEKLPFLPVFFDLAWDYIEF